MFGLGLPELLVLLAIVVIVFGATRLPQIGKGLGEGIRNFRSATREPSQLQAPSEGSTQSAQNPERSRSEPG